MYEAYAKDIGVARGEREMQGAMVSVLAMVFSNAPEMSLLAAAYSDGDLVLFDMAEGIVIATVYANAQILACSSDGRTLASGDSNGTIQLLDFGTLRYLYRIKSEDYGIKALAFSADCHRLLDIRGSHCRVWDPLALIRQTEDEQQSDTVSISTNLQEVSLNSIDRATEITAIACHDDGEVFFCGKEDGSVALYEVKTGLQSTVLFWHTRGVSIISLIFATESQLICSVDSSSRVMIHKIAKSQRSWTAVDTVLDYRAGVAIDDLIVNSECSRMLLCSATKDSLFAISAAKSTILKSLDWEERGSYRWISHPMEKHMIILITKHEACLYEWLTLDKINSLSSIKLACSLSPDLNIRSITPCFGGTVLATLFTQAMGSSVESKLVLWDAASFSRDSERIDSIPDSQTFADHVELLVGNYGQKVIYLDNRGYVFSASRVTFERTCHFFVPADWLRTKNQLMLKVTRDGDILFVKHDEVAVIKRGLNSVDTGSLPMSSRRPSLFGSKGLSLRSSRSGDASIRHDRHK